MDQTLRLNDLGAARAEKRAEPEPLALKVWIDGQGCIERLDFAQSIRQAGSTMTTDCGAFRIAIRKPMREIAPVTTPTLANAGASGVSTPRA
ncbi:hypothetical protein [Brevundimonas nasdae]|uniref:Uncharacterized protein n=1 Tax=Brevundimonas nasdae TaxID=172043 RepID=A0ABX8TD68_9CAUL|nr:hypothetical protein [Brevundimonas nasdae]QYC09136.1 hypothetical protein KWG56_10885 [Brevundimonas nasdae]QYC15186.1 hypothetical protein KWG63_06220 [Brevundimonas nasdae]